MIDGRADASDSLRLNDVLRTAEEVIEECLTPRATEGWGGSEGVSPFFPVIAAYYSTVINLKGPKMTRALAVYLVLARMGVSSL